MGTATERVLAVMVLLTVQFVYCSAQGGCSPPAGILMTGDDKLTNNVSTILTDGLWSICKLGHAVLDYCHIRLFTQICDQSLVVREQTGGQCTVRHRLEIMVCGVRCYHLKALLVSLILETGTTLLETHLMASLWSPLLVAVVYPTSH